MARPLIQCGIGDLERTFAEAPEDSKTLRALKQELGFRQVPRAVALLAKVNLALKTLGPPVDSNTVDAAVEPPRDSPDLPSTPSSDLFQHSTPVREAIAMLQPEARLPSPVSPKPAKKSFDLTPEAAYALLHASASSTWESIEEKRQAIVRRASPEHCSELDASQRKQMIFDAERVNTAYGVLLRERSKNIG